MRILIIEDELRLARTLKDMAAQDGYAADIACDGDKGLDDALTGAYDAIVLDVMLPKLDGFEVLRRLRAEGVATPVLMLTARADLADRVQGLDLGADYYLTKPFENAEFRACLRAVTRRQGDMIPEEIVFSDLILVPSDSRLSCAKQSLTLSVKEMEILRLLMLNHQGILSKDTLLVKVWGYDTDAGDNNVEAYISFLRKKLFLLHSTVEIRAIRRQGYRLEAKK